MHTAQTHPHFPSKLPQLGTTIFTVMSRLAQEVQAINLSQGFPDFECHPQLIDLVTHYMKKGANQYAPMAGMPALREQISIKTEETYRIAPNPEKEITVVSGASEAIFNALAAVVRPGDEVIIFEPAYDLYQPIIELFGGKAIPVPLHPDDYAIQWTLFQQALNEKTKVVMINSPHNPSGTALKAEDMQQLNEIAQNQDFIIISDEVYEHIIFDGQEHQSVLRYPELRQRSFAIFSFGKTFHATGWKIGYCIAPEYFTQEFRKIHQYNTFATFTPAQLALADFLKEKEHYLSLADFYQERRDRFRALMQATPFKLLPCEGTYFQVASYGHLSQEKDTAYTERLTRQVGVATIPLSPFYIDGQDHKAIRFCFAKKYETMEQAVEKIIQNEVLLYEK